MHEQGALLLSLSLSLSLPLSLSPPVTLQPGSDHASANLGGQYHRHTWSTTTTTSLLYSYPHQSPMLGAAGTDKRTLTYRLYCSHYLLMADSSIPTYTNNKLYSTLRMPWSPSSPEPYAACGCMRWYMQVCSELLSLLRQYPGGLTQAVCLTGLQAKASSNQVSKYSGTVAGDTVQWYSNRWAQYSDKVPGEPSTAVQYQVSQRGTVAGEPHPPTRPPACSSTRPPACPPACPTRPPARLHACILPAHLPARTPAHLCACTPHLACQPACLPTCLPACPPNCAHALLTPPAFPPACLPSCPPACPSPEGYRGCRKGIRSAAAGRLCQGPGYGPAQCGRAGGALGTDSSR